ncbi:MAG: hypothetical protein ABWZ57_08025 [Mesorhizobium sp.]
MGLLAKVLPLQVTQPPVAQRPTVTEILLVPATFPDRFAAELPAVAPVTIDLEAE